jgi:hypothetical protein
VVTASGESRLAIEVIAVMVRIDVERADAFAGKPCSYNIKSVQFPVGARLGREEAFKA